MGFGADPTLTYRRVPECVEVNSWNWDRRIPELLNCRPNTYCDRSNLYPMGLCGNLYRICLEKGINESVEIITNPRLATLGFQQELDAFSAFQEITMFLGSALVAEPFVPDTVGDDELVARSKGFDEHSFRTASPGAKKANRKRNKEAKRRRFEG